MAVSPPVLIRPLRSQDAEAVRELVGRLGAWFDAEGRARIGRDLGTQAGFVAAQGPRIVGFILWARIDAAVADLTWMGVAEPMQRRGVGTALLAALVTNLRSSGFHALEVSTVADNVEYEPYDRTRRFYRARGFADHRIDPGYWGSGEDRYDRLVLRRDLAIA